MFAAAQKSVQAIIGPMSSMHFVRYLLLPARPTVLMLIAVLSLGFLSAEHVGMLGIVLALLLIWLFNYAYVLLEQIANNAVMLIDVRSKLEWNSGHHRDAHHIPLGDLPRALATLPRDRPIAVYCQRGTRSAVASSLLSAAGIEAVNVPSGWIGIEAAQGGS